MATLSSGMAFASVMRGVLGLCISMLAVGSVAACGEDVANPIVRVTPSTGGVDGNDGNGGNAGNAGNAGKGNADSGDLCSPCGSRSDCNNNESCVALTRNGDRFCSHSCGNGNGHCPSGFVCGDVNNVSSMQCVPESGNCNQVVP